MIDIEKELEEAKEMFGKHQQFYKLLNELYPEPNHYGLENARMIFENKRLNSQVRFLNLQRLNEANPPLDKG